MTKFEYITKIEFRCIGDPEWLNIIGIEGWELVSVIPLQDDDGVELLRYYLKRTINTKDIEYENK